MPYNVFQRWSPVVLCPYGLRPRFVEIFKDNAGHERSREEVGRGMVRSFGEEWFTKVVDILVSDSKREQCHERAQTCHVLSLQHMIETNESGDQGNAQPTGENALPQKHSMKKLYDCTAIDPITKKKANDGRRRDVTSLVTFSFFLSEEIASILFFASPCLSSASAEGGLRKLMAILHTHVATHVGRNWKRAQALLQSENGGYCATAIVTYWYWQLVLHRCPPF